MSGPRRFKRLVAARLGHLARRASDGPGALGKRRPDGPRSAPPEAISWQGLQATPSHYAGMEGRFDWVSSSRKEGAPSPFPLPKGEGRASRRLAEVLGFCGRRARAADAGSLTTLAVGRSGLLSPIWRTIQCQSPSETEFLLSSKVIGEAGWASRAEFWRVRMYCQQENEKGFNRR